MPSLLNPCWAFIAIPRLDWLCKLVHATHTESLTLVLVHISSFYNTTFMSLKCSSRICCSTSPTNIVFGFFFFYNSLKMGDCMLKQWHHGATVGWGNWWFNCIVINMQIGTLSVCITAHHPLMMACIDTNTQTCTYTVHTVYLYANCTHAHKCIYACAWIRYGSDPTTVTNWWDVETQTQYDSSSISKVHWESWWDCENVAPFPFLYFRRYVLFLLSF